MDETIEEVIERLNEAEELIGQLIIKVDYVGEEIIKDVRTELCYAIEKLDKIKKAF